MKRRKSYQPKRERLWQVIAKALCVSLVLVLAFAWVTREYLYQSCRQQAREQIRENTARMQQYISQIQGKTDPKWQMQEIRAKLLLWNYYGIYLEDPTAPESDPSSGVQIIPNYSENCHSIGALIAEDNTIAAANQQTLAIMLLFQKDKNTDKDRGFYFCDADALNLPEVDQLYQDLRELSGQEEWGRDTECYVQTGLTSIYVNRETRTFIPHEGYMQLMKTKYDNSHLVETSQAETLDRRDIRIDLNLPGYELLELTRGFSDDAYPKYMLFTFSGEEQAEFDRYDDLVFQDTESGWTSGGFCGLDDGTELYSTSTPLYVDGKPYFLELRFRFNPDDPQILALWRRWILLFTGAVLIVAALWVWRRQTLNRAKYAFEDMRRDLTDHLAHDIKTPLTAIGGYAENILDGRLSGDEHDRYLRAILDNVAFTDSLISRTLELNRADGKPAKREKLAVKPMLEDALRKYAPLLEEKHIECTVSGDAEWLCDRTGLETILENLISNAVKYTPEGGSIDAKLTKTRLTVTNTVTEQIPVKDLKTPFVRGDAARSNTEGCGLGLSLADHAAAANGMTLRLSCTDKAFSAVLAT